MTPFDTIALKYASLWSSTQTGVVQRAQVWREIDALFQPGQHILDLGCGTGDDALHLISRGVRVTAIDIAPAMVETARARGIEAFCAPIETLSISGTFDGVLSDFGALNCVANLSDLTPRLAPLLRPGGTLAFCVLARFCWRESLRFALRGDFARATRRWSGHAQWRGIDVYYRTASQYREALSPAFVFRRRVSIGGGDHTLYLFERTAR